MKPTKKIIMTFALAAFAAGCDKPSTTSQQLDKVEAKTKEAAHDLKDYSYAEKAEFVAKRQNQLDEINRGLDQLAVEIEKSSDAAKAEARPKYQALREKADQLGKQLAEVRNSSESTWDSVKAASAKAFDELKESFQQAQQWLSNKIAP